MKVFAPKIAQVVMTSAIFFFFWIAPFKNLSLDAETHPMIDFPKPPAVVQRLLELREIERPAPRKDLVRRGTASWYSESDPGINLHTANGEVFDDQALTCASWDYPFDTRLAVSNPSNGKMVIVRVNDRGPARRLNRLIDLTKQAFSEIADPRGGLVEVEVSPLVETA